MVDPAGGGGASVKPPLLTAATGLAVDGDDFLISFELTLILTPSFKDKSPSRFAGSGAPPCCIKERVNKERANE